MTDGEEKPGKADVIVLQAGCGCAIIVKRKEQYKSVFERILNMDEQKKNTVEKTVKSGITFGSALAMVISYTTWHSVGWAIFHGLLSWVYVIYFILRY